MLRIIPGTSAAAAIAYYNSGLKREDYYAEELLVPSAWHGKGAKRLGLSGEVTPEHFAALANNKHPFGGERLTPRQGNDQGRIPGWDFNFHAPKSLSVLQGITGDEKMLAAFRSSVADTMADIEKIVATRVRLDGRQDDRVTGNFAWAEFVHFTARPVGKIPDPHLHTHAWVFNATFDEIEDRWKAAKVHDIKVDAPFFQALFHSRLAKSMADLGYSIIRTRHAWEIVGVDKSIIAGSSRRTAEIEAMAEHLGITDAKAKSELGAKTRKAKQGELTREQLVEAWKERLNPEQRASLENAYHGKPTPANFIPISAADALDFAEAKVFEKQSVVRYTNLLTEALRFGVGHTTLEQIQDEILRRGHIQRKVDGDHLVTTVPIIIEEAELIQRVRGGLGKLAPIHNGRLRIANKSLSDEQKAAVRHILKSNDQVIALRGKAGAGKTTLLTEVRERIQAQGLRLFAFAPSAEASRGVLRDEQFHGANTVAHFLANKNLQRKCKGHIILIDEAGTVGIRDLAKILEIAGTSTRIILSGDTGQHMPVPRGDALYLLENYAGLPVATVRYIHRQQKDGYRRAVAAIAEGDLKAGFALLDDLKAFREIPNAEFRYRQLAEDYQQCLLETGKAPLVVSPTHAEAKAVTSALRQNLTAQGKLGPERQFLQYRALNWAEVEKLKPENYTQGLAVKFHQNVPGIKRGTILAVLDVDADQNIWLEGPKGSRIPLNLQHFDRFRLFEIDRINMAKVDSLRITENAFDANGRRMNNGSAYTVKSIGKDGTITLSNGLKLNPNFGHIDHGYCRTSHSSQGKTVGTVFIAQSASSFLASSHEGFYVSVSRGKQDLRIYTDDRFALQKAVGNSSRRLSALEFTGLGEALLMNGGLSGTEWTKRVGAERGGRQGAFDSQLGKLAAQRKMETPVVKSFTAYLEMQRGIAGPDGKSRSKGRPLAPGKGLKGEKGITVPRRVEMNEGLMEKATAKPKPTTTKENTTSETKPQIAPRESRFTKAFNTMKTRLSEIVKRNSGDLEGVKKSAERKIQFGNLKTTLGKLNSPKVQKEQVKQQRQAKPPAQKPKPPTPPPPTRGRR
ncbi:MAG: MobF family relaxase [Luteolibacter sp.]|uniref:MobF family relaxase n=1 Tax=Luteolibacter sp. TaxID=1962973 RepID=UPI003267BE46